MMTFEERMVETLNKLSQKKRNEQQVELHRASVEEQIQRDVGQLFNSARRINVQGYKSLKSGHRFNIAEYSIEVTNGEVLQRKLGRPPEDSDYAALVGERFLIELSDLINEKLADYL